MKKISLLILFIITLHANAQIASTGYKIYSWGSNKNTIPVLAKCSQTNAGDQFSNCEINNKDSIFYAGFHYSYCNFRFYKEALVEVHFDLRFNELGGVVAKLSTDFGAPKILENATTRADTLSTTIGYEWIVGDTRVLIINKGIASPVWCILSSQSHKKAYRKKVIDIEKIIFN
jgi:hypothetical protein